MTDHVTPEKARREANDVLNGAAITGAVTLRFARFILILAAQVEELEKDLNRVADEARGWQAEWTKVIRRERVLRRCIAAARPLVDDEEWHESAAPLLQEQGE